MNSSVMGGADARAAVASELLHLQTRTSFPNPFAMKYSVPYAKTFGSTSAAIPAVGSTATVAVIGRRLDPDFDATLRRLEQDLSGSGIEVKGFRVEGLFDGTTGGRQADADKALLERIADGVTTQRVLLIDDAATVSASVIRNYADSVDASTPSVAVLNFTGAEGELYEAATAYASPSQPEGGDFDFEFELEFDDAAGTHPSHQIVLNEILKPGLGIGLETSRLRKFVAAMPVMSYPWLVSGMIREAYLDGLQLHRYGVISSADSDTWSPGGLTPIQLHEASSGNKLQGVTITIAAGNTSREALVATVDSLLLSEDVAFNISIVGLGGASSLNIADGYSATGTVRVDRGQPSVATTLVQMGVEAGIVFGPQSLRKILDHAATLDYSVLRLITGQSDSKIEVWPTSLLATALRLADDGNIDEFVLSHAREHWNSGSQFDLTLVCPSAASTAR